MFNLTKFTILEQTFNFPSEIYLEQEVFCG